MPRFAANLTWLFNEHPMMDRFAAAADAGFTAVEILFPYDHPADEIAEALRRNRLDAVLFNAPAGDFANGERGYAALPHRFADLQASVRAAITYARACGVRRLHLMAGLASPDDPVAVAAFSRAVLWSAEEMARHDIELMLEPINARDMPGYFLNSFDLAETLIAKLARPNVRLQFDVYHRQIMHGDVTTALRRLLPLTGHIQIASVPSRHEPFGEEINYPFLFNELDRLGYDGFVGCEYRPRGTTLEGLGWFDAYRKRG